MGRLLAKCVLSAAFVILMLPGSSFAQTGSIQGKAVGEDGQPVSGAVVKIERKDIRGSYTTKTNRKGEYFHAGLPAGRATNYSVTLEVNGTVVDLAEHVVIPLGESRTVDFNLAERKKQRDELAKAADSGTLTAEQTRGMSAEQREAIEKALKERQAALSKNKALSDAFNQGMEAMKAQQYQVAVDAFTKATELDPKQSAVWGQLAEAYSELAKTKSGAEQDAALGKSVEAFQKSIELKPDDAAYHNNYALVLVRAKKIPEGVAELEKAAQLMPADAGKFYYNMGAVMMNTGQLDAAGEAFKKAIALSPGYAPAQFQYGLYLLGKASIGADGKIQPPPGTVEVFKTYLTLEPTGPEADQAKGILASLDQAIETNYANPESRKKTAPKKK
jgi:tetratricopeptide (TPR) repeat protein